MSHDIDISKAQQFIDNFQEANDGVFALLYNKDKIEKILNQKNCAGIRIYYALKQDGEKTLIIVGYDGSQKDLNANLSEFVAEYGIANIDPGSPLL
ncbi:MAG: hypothetical protein JSW64_06940 [Candidatus Zixiibacteriota bacterium]|nr:MAG: hypothetical protein JSW64_06940 [candidate division Zixibacteria bacterium]